MRFRLRTLLILSATVPPLLGGAWLFEWSGFSTNCGGNNAAKTYVREYGMVMTMLAEESSAKQFSLDAATPTQRLRLASIKTGWGVTAGDIFISAEPLRLSDTKNRRVVVICSRPFTNVPRYLFHRAAPSHAVAFGDGSTALVNAQELAAIDRATFRRASEIAHAAR